VTITGQTRSRGGHAERRLYCQVYLVELAIPNQKRMKRRLLFSPAHRLLPPGEPQTVASPQPLRSVHKYLSAIKLAKQELPPRLNPHLRASTYTVEWRRMSTNRSLWASLIFNNASKQPSP